MIQISRAMTRIVAVVAAVGSFLPALAQENGGQKERLNFTTVLKNPITPVKNQSRRDGRGFRVHRGGWMVNCH